MTHITAYPDYSFCWAELISSEAEGAKQFYTQLFDWTAHDEPIGEDSTYTMLQLEGHNVAALYEKKGVTPAWLLYISVDDVDAIAAQAESFGGKILVEPQTIATSGRMAHLADPLGARFGIWEPHQHIGAERFGEPNTLCWFELATRDHQQIGEFYSDIFLWNLELNNIGITTYTTFFNGGLRTAGMIQMTEEWGDMPCHWMTYFAVANCRERAALAIELGGQVMVPPTDIPGVGRFAVIQDPQGGIFSILEISS